MPKFESAITISLVEEARGGPFVLWDDLGHGAETAIDFGFDAIEIFAPGPDAIDRKVLRPFQDDGLQVAAIGTGAGWLKHRWSLADDDAPRRQKAIEFVKSMIDVACELNAATIIGSMQGRSDSANERATAMNHLQDSLHELGLYAQQNQQRLLIEPLNRYETNHLNSVASGLELIEQVAVDSLYLLCDLFHMNIEESSTAGALVKAGKWLGHVHFVDNNRRAVGFGQMQLAAIMEALRQIDYDGYLSVEAFPLPDSESTAAQAMEAFHYWT